MVTDFQVPLHTGNFFINQGTTSFQEGLCSMALVNSNQSNITPALYIKFKYNFISFLKKGHCTKH
jgi:hypothetical protein